jgi:hypothetical protein
VATAVSPDGGLPAGDSPRFPTFDVLRETDTWDEVTSGVVLRRLAPAPSLRFFTIIEEAAARALLDRLLDQPPEGDARPRVPVTELVDTRLAELQTDGWRYEDLPPDDQTWRRSLAALDEDARATGGRCFAELPPQAQEELLGAVQSVRDACWHGMRADHVWNLWLRYACTAFYAHPWAWNEIGFGGPAYPRGYKNLGLDAREPWEEADQRPRDPLRETT